MILTLDKVCKSVGASVYIDNVSMVLESGSLNVLLGATLAGKTSLMRLMAGLDKPSSGRIYSMKLMSAALISASAMSPWFISNSSITRR